MNKSPERFSISFESKGNAEIRQLPFKIIKNDILGPDYEMSLVFIGDEKSKELNKKYRNKNYPTNILSFPLSDNEGEIFINLNQAKKEHADFDMTYKNFIAYLFIHGVLHLNGLEHSSRMNKQEQLFLNKYILN